jgi:hypothetical protein
MRHGHAISHFFGLLQVHKDKLTVSYAGKANHNQDVGVRGNHQPRRSPPRPLCPSI